MPGPICCLLGACCPPKQQVIALTAWYVSQGMDEVSAKRWARKQAPILRAAHRAAVKLQRTKVKK